MHIHILGICGKFMSGLAIIARQSGFEVSGCDQTLLPAVVAMLRENGIKVIEGYDASAMPAGVDCVIVGNALSRGKPIVEYMLNSGLPFFSGPEWLSRHVLTGRWVLAVSGTHGKTTTTSMLAWILDFAGLDPGFLIGGNAVNFDFSARYRPSNFFVIEADEYDTAFFDKRSKFLHYQPRTLIINNLEFDHADIFSDLEDIKKQFCHLLRIVPGNGLIVAPKNDEHVQSLFPRGCWTQVETFDLVHAEWFVQKLTADGSEFQVFCEEKAIGTIRWNLVGDHNIQNALAALAAARHAGVPPNIAIEALSQFQGVRRRLELKGVVKDIHIYDDFAHHPTAIAATLGALRSRVGNDRIFAVLEFGSNTMRAGHHEKTICSAFDAADRIVLLQPRESNWKINDILPQFDRPVELFDNVSEIVTYLGRECQAGDHILCMSNMMFDNIHQKILSELAASS